MSDNLDQLYNRYTEHVTELEALDERRLGGTPYYDAIVDERDAVWQQYVDAHGGRPKLHEPLHVDERPDGFRVLSRGMTGDDVSVLQERLRIMPTGEFDAFTEARLRGWQTNHNLEPTGALDRLTLSTFFTTGEPADSETADADDDAQLEHDVAATPLGEPTAPIVIRLNPPKTRWALALDDSPEGSFATLYNLGLMSELAYQDPGPISDFFEGLVRLFCRRERAASFKSDGRRWMPIFRVAPSDEYSVPAFVDETSTSTQLFMTANSRHALISVRGTAELVPDLATDAQAFLGRWWWPRKDSLGNELEAPSGFLKAFRSIKEFVDPFVEQALADNPSKPIFLTGHSLGGAVAMLIACYLRYRLGQSHPIHLYTFGQPRTAQRHMAEEFWGTHRRLTSYFRLVHRYDPVPMVPRRDMRDFLFASLRPLPDTLELALTLCPPEDYYHFGTLLRFDNLQRIERVASTDRRVEDDAMVAEQGPDLLRALNYVRKREFRHELNESYLDGLLDDFMRRRGDYDRPDLAQSPLPFVHAEQQLAGTEGNRALANTVAPAAEREFFREAVAEMWRGS